MGEAILRTNDSSKFWAEGECFKQGCAPVNPGCPEALKFMIWFQLSYWLSSGKTIKVVRLKVDKCYLACCLLLHWEVWTAVPGAWLVLLPKACLLFSATTRLRWGTCNKAWLFRWQKWGAEWLAVQPWWSAKRGPGHPEVQEIQVACHGPTEIRSHYADLILSPFRRVKLPQSHN